MLKKIATAVTVLTLSGCSIMHADDYHRATLTAIQASEHKIGARFNKLERQLDNQTDYIDSLEYEISTLKKQVKKLNSIVYVRSQIDRRNADEAKETTQPTTPPMPTHEIILGAVEHITIDAAKRTLDARVDTGAATSSINAADIEEFERNGDKWVRFHLADDEGNDNADWIEAPIDRRVRIMQANSEEAAHRFVVKLWVTVGDIHEKTEFTLSDRSQMSYPVLLGREFIRDIALVDVSRKYIHTQQQTDNTDKLTDTQTDRK